MSKSKEQLLKEAQKLNLDVTEDNTKAEIEAALKSSRGQSNSDVPVSNVNVSRDNGEDTGKMATEAENRADAEAAAPEKDELQLKREALASKGLAHGSLNNYVPQKKEEFSEAEKQGDEANKRPSTVAPSTRKAPVHTKEGQPVVDGEPLVPSDPVTQPGV